jgi:hypothetical protein
MGTDQLHFKQPPGGHEKHTEVWEVLFEQLFLSSLHSQVLERPLGLRASPAWVCAITEVLRTPAETCGRLKSKTEGTTRHSSQVAGGGAEGAVRTAQTARMSKL